MAEVVRCAVPDRARELAALGRTDYADCYTVAVTAQRAPVEWVRLCVRSLPSLFRAVRLAHRSLGLQVAPEDDADHVFGWKIDRSGASEAVLANEGILGRPRIVLLSSPDRVSAATLIELNGLTGRALWHATAPVHRAVARRILGRLPSLGVPE